MAFDLQRLKSLFDIVASAFALKSGQRSEFYCDVVQRDFDCIKATHKEFHSTLFRVRQSLDRIEVRLRAGDDIAGALADLQECLADCTLCRIANQADRIELYQHCLSIVRRGRHPFRAVVTPMDDSEWDILRLFAASICRYLGGLSAYGHDLGNVMNWLSGRLQMWLLVTPPSAGDIRKTVQDVDDAIGRLTTRWVEISRNFQDISNILRLNFDIDPIRQADIERQIEAVDREIQRAAVA